MLLARRILSMESSIRWGFNYGRWTPTADQWRYALSLVQPEEKTRIQRFVFQRDAKAALSGRLLMRKAAVSVLGLSYKDVSFGRTDKLRPFVVNDVPSAVRFDFNVSHQGDWAVLAAEARRGIAADALRVGIDVMELERPIGSRTIAEFFETMKRQFTRQEWDMIRGGGYANEQQQLHSFYRFWCLKESYVKALGVGVGFNLHRLDMQVKSALNQNIPVCDTVVNVDGRSDADWIFEESVLDNTHIACVALNVQDTRKSAVVLQPVERMDNFDDLSSPQANIYALHFKELSLSELLDGSESLTEICAEDWNEFCSKDLKPMRRNVAGV